MSNERYPYISHDVILMLLDPGAAQAEIDTMLITTRLVNHEGIY